MSFEELVKKISPTLKRITYKLNGHFTFFNDDDLYQEALMHLWVDFRDGKLGDKTDSYILQGCYFHLKNYIRKARDKAYMVSMDALVNQDGTDLEEILGLPHTESCSKVCENNILLEEIDNLGLTQREKDILSLYMEGLTVREIGSRLKISHVMVLKLKKKIQDRCEKFKKEIISSYQGR